jgi:hypothetical protein
LRLRTEVEVEDEVEVEVEDVVPPGWTSSKLKLQTVN